MKLLAPFIALAYALVLLAFAAWCALRWAKHQDKDGNF